jgi:hypothetical protein
MSRRLVGTTLVATSLLVGMPHSFAAAPEAPRAVCPDERRVNDGGGDGKVNFGQGAEVRDPRPEGSNPGLDIVSVDLRVTADEVQAFVGLTDLPTTFQKYEAAYVYDVNFTLGSLPFTFSAAVTNPDYATGPLHPGNADAYPKAKATGGAGDIPMTNVTGGLVPEHKSIAVVAPRASVQSAIDDPIKDGTKLTAISAKTSVWLIEGNGSSVTAKPADTTAASTFAYTVGDDYCFGPPPAALSALATPSVHYTDSVTLSAVLKDEAGAVLAGQPVTFTVAGEKPLTKATDPNGVAKVTYKPTRPAGKYDLLVTYAGDAANGQTKLPGTVTVLAEATKFATLAVTKPSATTRTVTATLLDDDNKPVGLQKVAWYVNGKKVTTLTTSSTGKTVLKTAKPGQTVQAKFTAVAGKFLASASKSVKV